jgi:gluconate 2-dehydrogenase
VFTGGSLTPVEHQQLFASGLDLEVAPADLDGTQLAAALAGKDAYILGGVEHATAASIVAADRLRVIAFYGVGYAGFIDTEAATRRGIAVTNAPGANARAVAEFTVALMLDCWRRVTHLTNRTKQGQWVSMPTRNAEGGTLGVVGMGTIGSQVAAIASTGFGMRVVYTNPSPRPEVEQQLGATRLSLDELLARSDLISLHVPYSPATHGLLDDRRLALVKPGAVLVNTSEAEIVDPTALRSAIQSGGLGAVAMDGYYVEPVPTPADDPYRLLELPDERFLVTPHTASATEESFRAMLEMNLSSIRNILDGNDDPHIVNPEFRKYAPAQPTAGRMR